MSYLAQCAARGRLPWFAWVYLAGELLLLALYAGCLIWMLAHMSIAG